MQLSLCSLLLERPISEIILERTNYHASETMQCEHLHKLPTSPPIHTGVALLAALTPAAIIWTHFADIHHTCGCAVPAGARHLGAKGDGSGAPTLGVLTDIIVVSFLRDAPLALQP